MKKLTFLTIFAFFTLSSFAQEESARTEKVWRINFLNPAAELELPTGDHSTFSAALGAGYGGSYPDLQIGGGTGLVYIIAPFVDLQQKWFYNFSRRQRRGRTVAKNSGNFISARFITRGHSIADNVNRTSNFDFAFGPTWGIQRSYREKYHLLLDLGPQYYFDTKGNGNIFPIMVQLNLGLDL